MGDWTDLMGTHEEGSVAPYILKWLWAGKQRREREVSSLDWVYGHTVPLLCINPAASQKLQQDRAGPGLVPKPVVGCLANGPSRSSSLPFSGFS